MKTPENAHDTPSTQRRDLSLDDYVSGVRDGSVPVLARALTLVESSRPEHQPLAERLLARLLPDTGNSIRVGVTGVPGVGKSTFIEALGLHLIGRGHRVAVLAVDPSSDVTGGSILGDKTRMTRLSAEPAAFIRPSPTAGSLGGVARKTREAMFVCEAANFDIVLIETVGVGQSEAVVADITDCLLGLMLPGAGDELQGIKRGLLERVDLMAVNKADGKSVVAAERAARQFEIALTSLAGRGEAAPEVLACSALQGRGIEQIWERIEQRQERMQQSGEQDERRRQQDVRWLWAIVDDQLREAVRRHPGVQGLRGDLERDVLAGVLPAESAARRILEASGFLTADPSPDQETRRPE